MRALDSSVERQRWNVDLAGEPIRRHVCETEVQKAEYPATRIAVLHSGLVTLTLERGFVVFVAVPTKCPGRGCSCSTHRLQVVGEAREA